MFNLISYIRSTSGALFIDDPLELEKPFPNEFPDDITLKIRKKQEKMLNKGLEWIFEKAKTQQPKFYQALIDEKFKLAVVAVPFEDPFSESLSYYSALCLVSEKVSFRLEPGIDFFEDDILNRPKDGWVRLFNSLPTEIASSYYLRADGMDLIRDEFFLNLYMTGMPGSLTAAQSALNIPMSKSMKKNAKDKLTSIMDKTVEDCNTDSLRFNILLNTENQETKSNNAGTMLIYEAFSPLKKIFVVPEMDFNKLRLLTDPVQAIDSYTSQVLMTGETKFDFESVSVKV